LEMQSQSLPYDLNNKWYPKQSSEEKMSAKIITNITGIEETKCIEKMFKIGVK